NRPVAQRRGRVDASVRRRQRVADGSGPPHRAERIEDVAEVRRLAERQAAALRIAARVCLLLSIFCLLAASTPIVVVLPFDDFSGNEAAARELTQLVVNRMEAKGWQ